MGVPSGDSACASMSVYNVSPELGIKVMEEHKRTLQSRLVELEKVARQEMEEELVWQ